MRPRKNKTPEVKSPLACPARGQSRRQGQGPAPLSRGQSAGPSEDPGSPGPGK